MVASGRHCTICLHSDRVAIEASIAAGASFRVVAGQFAVSGSALQRHWANHAHGQIATLTAVEYLSTPADLAERIEEISNSARNMRRAAEASGNALHAVRASDIELKAINAMAERYGISDGKLIGNFQVLLTVLRGVLPVVREHPAVGREILANIPLTLPEAELAREQIQAVIDEAEKKKQGIEK